MAEARLLRAPVLLAALLALLLVAGCGQSAVQDTSQESSQEAAAEESTTGAGEMGQTSAASEAGGTTSGGPGTMSGTTGESTSAEGDSGLSAVTGAYSAAQEEIEEAGGEKVVDGYRVGYIVEDAESWWEGEPGNLRWREPAPDETNHIEILPYDRESGQFVPYMDVRLTVLDESGEAVDRHDLGFYWSTFKHYSNNFSVPETGTYTLRAELQAPDFYGRHQLEGKSREQSKVFTEPVTVEFEGVEIGG
ncbi:iron transporter [Rubrobacter aplysinae]|uniref:iron transporter n=1 Tax=Rubrobacter aplysinae TaxID=909625 RepID=UPI00069E16B4|nr:iron transporter [Rubrobacter aplysinae]